MTNARGEARHRKANPVVKWAFRLGIGGAIIVACWIAHNQIRDFFYWCAPYEIVELHEPMGTKKIVAYNVLCGVPLRKNPSTHVSVLPGNATLHKRDIGNALIAKGLVRLLTSEATSDMPQEPWLLVHWQSSNSVQIKLSDGIVITERVRKIGPVSIDVVSK